MKRSALLTLVLSAFAPGAFAQAPAADAYAYILEAAPPNQREGATVIKWKADYTYDTLKKGTNRLVCYELSGMPGQLAFSIECTSEANLARAAQNLKFEAAGDKAKTQALLDEAEKTGTRPKPEFGSVWFHLQGPSKEQARKHMTVALPGATTASTGLPDNPRQGGAWIMNAGTSTAHLMVPGE
jgi:hypothetical protein